MSPCATRSVGSSPGAGEASAAPRAKSAATLKYGQLVCDGQGNVGDDIQALAAAQHLPRIDLRIDRESIDKWTGRYPVALVMNGWFAARASAWPPAPSIHPVFVSFHVTERFKPVVTQHVDYLKRFEPIGTRDEATARFLRSIGVAAEVTYCMTLTFPQRQAAPRDGKVYLVDATSIAVPRALRKGAVKMSHTIAPIGHEQTLPYAQRLLDLYRDTARLVITTRLHTALPCIAMGIPVVFFHSNSDGRTSVIRDIGGKIYDARLHSKALVRGAIGRLIDPVDWSPAPLDIAPFKKRLAEAVAKRLAAIEQLHR